MNLSISRKSQINKSNVKSVIPSQIKQSKYQDNSISKISEDDKDNEQISQLLNEIES